MERGGLLYGKAFENWVFHELVVWDSYAERSAGLAYWRLAGGAEVDFIVGEIEVVIEAKASRKITSDHLRHLRSLVVDHPKVGKRIVVRLEETPRLTVDGILVLPAAEFVARLYSGDIF